MWPFHQVHVLLRGTGCIYTLGNQHHHPHQAVTPQWELGYEAAVSPAPPCPAPRLLPPPPLPCGVHASAGSWGPFYAAESPPEKDIPM